MKLSANRRRSHVSREAMFYGYRWVAWAIAGLALAAPGIEGIALPRDAILLLLSGVVTVLATAIAPSYLALARRRPPILGLDILVSMMIVWLSGSRALPYLPFALGSLVLPALLFGWRGALISGTLLALLDQLGLAMTRADADVSSQLLVMRAALPVLFALGVAGLGRLLQQSQADVAAEADPPEVSPSIPPQSRPAQSVGSGSYARLVDTAPMAEGPAARATPELSAPPWATVAPRPLPERTLDAPRRAIHALTPGLDVELPAALGQLVQSFGRTSGIDMQMHLVGVVQHLSAAQHSVLLRLTQEALLNVQQHARAHIALVTLSYEPGAVALAVQDDGVGLLDGTHERPGVHALRAMGYRIAELDGQLEVFEGESGGVTVRARLPLDERGS